MDRPAYLLHRGDALAAYSHWLGASHWRSATAHTASEGSTGTRPELVGWLIGTGRMSKRGVGM